MLQQNLIKSAKTIVKVIFYGLFQKFLSYFETKYITWINIKHHLTFGGLNVTFRAVGGKKMIEKLKKFFNSKKFRKSKIFEFFFFFAK